MQLVLVTARRLETDTVTVRVQPAVVIGVWRGESDSESECVRPTVRWQRSVGPGQYQLVSQTLLKWFWISDLDFIFLNNESQSCHSHEMSESL